VGPTASLDSGKWINLLPVPVIEARFIGCSACSPVTFPTADPQRDPQRYRILFN